MSQMENSNSFEFVLEPTYKSFLKLHLVCQYLQSLIIAGLNLDSNQSSGVHSNVAFLWSAAFLYAKALNTQPV